MATKCYKIRLYYPHDLDLISYMRFYELDIVKAIYCAATAFCKGDSFVIQKPESRSTPLDKRKTYSRSLYLDTEKDAELCELLNEITPGYRNNFFKNILRLYLIQPVSESFFKDKKYMAELHPKIDVLQKDKRVVAAGTKKKDKNSSSKPKRMEKKSDSKESEKTQTEKNPAEFGKRNMGASNLPANPDIDAQESVFEKTELNDDAAKTNEEGFSSENSQEEEPDLTQLFSDLIK